MLNVKYFEEFIGQTGKNVVHDILECRTDVEKNMHVILEGLLTRMNLVTREDFEIQSEILAKTQTRLNSLEDRIAKLEQQNNSSADLSE
jgi:BMFP domain-containing protein YqiC